MAIYYGCDIPEDLFFDFERDLWVRFESDGTATLGMTDTAQTRGGKLVNIAFKKVGKTLKQGQSAATIESAKWVGPFPMPFGGEVLAINQETFQRDILIANRDPYGAGWLVKVRPTNLLIGGADAVEKYKQRIAELNIKCFRCID
ncbi:MAG: glycine cleavage system protein H [Chloroflexi bacterium]|nr:glycine cleavage system protein H [Chloroflexota bacterium]